MALKNLTARLQSWATDTPDTPEKITGYQCKANIHAGCTLDTPDTPCLSDTREVLQIGPFGEAWAANNSNPPPEPPADPHPWRELAATYHAHHVNCPTCIAAGRGSRYGERCGAGMALWRAYCE